MTHRAGRLFHAIAKGIRFQIWGFQANLQSADFRRNGLKSLSAVPRSRLAAGLIDQAIVSFGNFGLNIALARSLPLHDYGVVSLVLSFMLFLNTLHAAMIGYPLSVRSAPADSVTQKRLLGTAALLTAACIPLAAVILGGALASLGRLDLLPFAIGALALWQLQEVYRRAALARSDTSTAIATDVVRYLGLLIILIAWHMAITIERTLALLAATSALAALPLLRFLRSTLRAGMGELPREAGIQWRLAAPVLGANLLVALSTQWFLWLMAWHQGAEISGALVALTSIVAISSPVMFGAENILVPEIARIRHALSFAELQRMIGARAVVCGLLLTPLFVFIAVFPETAIRLFYGAGSPFVHAALPLRLLVPAYACFVVSYILGAVLRGFQNGFAIFRMQFFPAVLGLTLGSWLTIAYGLTGACLATLLAGLLRAGLGLYFVLGLKTTLRMELANVSAGAAPP